MQRVAGPRRQCALRPELGAAAPSLWGQWAFPSAECLCLLGALRPGTPEFEPPPCPRPGSACLRDLLLTFSDVLPSPLLSPVSLSSAVPHLCGGWRVRPLPRSLEPPGVPFHGRRRLQRRGRTVTAARGRGR